LALWNANPDAGFRLVGRAWVLDRMHRRAESRAALAELEQKTHEGGPYFIGYAYALLGDLDPAFHYFDIAFEHGDVAVIDVVMSPWLDNVHRDPRYAALVRKMGLLDAN
jgi:hypothetical protein